MNHYLFTLKEGASVEEAYRELGSFLTDLYEIEDIQTQNIQIGGYGVYALDRVLASVEFHSMSQAIDWSAQWEAFSPHFDQGRSTIPLPEGRSLLLLPGPGFGDGSHPTTRLLLDQIPQLAPGKVVVDLGCGCGILGIAAALSGARVVYGIDIDPEALAHAQQNAALNGVSLVFSCEVPLLAREEDVLILMNMIPQEQQMAWSAATALHGIPAQVLTSGVLSSRFSLYLEWVAKTTSWTLQHHNKQDKWMLFNFIQN